MPRALRRAAVALILLVLLPPLGYLAAIAAFNAGLGRVVVQQALRQALKTSLGPHGRVVVDRCLIDPQLHLRCEGLRLEGALEGEPLSVTCRTMALRESLVAIWRHQRASLAITDAGLHMPSAQLDGLSLVMDQFSWAAPAETPQPVGTFSVDRLRAGQLELRQLRGELWQGLDRWAVKPLRGQCYSGTLTGSVTLATEGAVSRIGLDAKVEGIRLTDLAPLNPDLFRGADGTGNAHLTVSGTVGHPLQYRCIFQIPQPGGAVQAAMLKAVLPYVPAAAPQAAKLREAVDTGQSVRFATARFAAESSTPTEIKALLVATLPEYNINLDIDFVIRLDDATALSQLLTLWDQLQGSS